MKTARRGLIVDENRRSRVQLSVSEGSLLPLCVLGVSCQGAWYLGGACCLCVFSGYPARVPGIWGGPGAFVCSRGILPGCLVSGGVLVPSCVLGVSCQGAWYLGGSWCLRVFSGYPARVPGIWGVPGAFVCSRGILPGCLVSGGSLVPLCVLGVSCQSAWYLVGPWCLWGPPVCT